MSVAVSKTDGVTVFTLTTDPQSPCPPLCQILKGLCYSPVCCSVSQHQKMLQRTSQSVLGALHFMVGLLNIGLGGILCGSGPGSSWEMDYTRFPFWLGALFILFGIINIFSEKYPSPCLVIVNVILNVSALGFAIAAIVLYSINTAEIWVWWMCRQDDYPYTPSPGEETIMNQCLEGKELVLMLLRGISGLLIVVSVLELCVAVSCVILGIKTLLSMLKKDEVPGMVLFVVLYCLVLLILLTYGDVSHVVLVGRQQVVLISAVHLAGWVNEQRGALMTQNATDHCWRKTPVTPQSK